MLHRDSENIHSQTNLRQHKRLIPSGPFLGACVGVLSERGAHNRQQANLIAGFCRPVYFEIHFKALFPAKTEALFRLGRNSKNKISNRKIKRH